MKPKTKFEKYIVEIDKSIKPLPDKYIDIAIRENVKHNAFRRADGTCYCLVCGGVFHYDKQKGKTICPHCGKKLDVETTTKKKNDTKFFWNCLDVHKGLQVVRGYYIELMMYVGQPMEVRILREVVRTYFDASEKKSMNLSLPFKQNGGWLFNPFMLTRDMSIHNDDNHIIGINPHIRRLIPELKRIGYFNLYEPVQEHIKHCLWDSHYQTLMETEQKKFIEKYIDQHLDNWWWQIKMCMRQNYIPDDVGMWTDTLRLVDMLGLDIKSPKYVCPSDLKAMHDMMMKRKQRKDKLEKIIRERKRLREIEEHNKLFEKRMSVFRTFRLNGDGWFAVPLVSIKDYYDEGEAMEHCVYTNRYYLEKNTIIFSVRSITGDRLATIEYNTQRKKILQCRAKNNGKVEKEKEINNLILANAIRINTLYAKAQKITNV